jgi:hypothetical protein
MSVEDLGTRELGQVRSQRLNEVSLCLFFSFVPLLLLCLFFDLPLMRNTVYAASSRKSTHSPSFHYLSRS